jgi:hypothetical protein
MEKMAGAGVLGRRALKRTTTLLFRLTYIQRERQHSADHARLMSRSVNLAPSAARKRRCHLFSVIDYLMKIILSPTRKVPELNWCLFRLDKVLVL